MKRYFAISFVLLFSLATVAAAFLEFVAPPEASVGGKYSSLLRVLPAPGDEATYGKFCETGYSNTPSWAGQNNLPAGYWVYVAPNWYIWQQQTGNKPAADDMTGKQVAVYLDNGTPVNGQLIENTPEHVVLLLAGQGKKKLIYKAKITSIEWPAADTAGAAPGGATPTVVPLGSNRLPPGFIPPSPYDGILVPVDLTKWNTR